MWRTAEEITADLKSGQPGLVAEALETLEFHHDTLEPVAVPLLTADMLDPFDGELPEETAARFCLLLDRYSGFEPAPERADVERELALAAARFGPSRLALEASLVLKTAAAPASAVRRALDAVAARGVKPAEVEHAAAFVSYLLAGKAPVRAAVVQALAGWVGQPGLDEVYQNVAAELEEDERTG